MALVRAASRTTGVLRRSIVGPQHGWRVAATRAALRPRRRLCTAAPHASGGAARATLQDIVSHKGVRWIALGWSGFILENLVMSHNREWIIEQFGKPTYHRVYNTLSTAACASIAYGFFRHGRRQGPRLWTTPRGAPIHLVAFALQALGLAGLSQLGPRFQIPVTLVRDTAGSDTAGAAAAGATVQGPAPAPLAGAAAGTKPTLAVRCPMDFRPRDMPEDGVFGVGRITRHAALWSMGLLGLGAALVTPFAAEAAFFGFPVVFALIGGSHQDYRFRRGWGGTLPPEVDEKTSNVPFLALITGGGSWDGLADELKLTNAAAAALVAGLFALRRRSPSQQAALLRAVHGAAGKARTAVSSSSKATRAAQA